MFIYFHVYTYLNAHDDLISPSAFYVNINIIAEAILVWYVRMLDMEVSIFAVPALFGNQVKPVLT